MLSPDNQYLFFTRRVEEDTKSIYGKQQRELFIQSRRKYDGSYSEGIPMPEPFNMGAYQGGTSISVDNKLIFITIVDQVATRDGRLFSNGDIYYSRFSDGKWGDLQSIGSHINGQYTWEGQPSISADNKTLYFASARGKDNYGGMDLYKTEWQDNGGWGEPQNLGPVINTSGNEKSPFMHSDSYTLYFSSDGHPGVGGQDIFYARINKFGKFDPPNNIGVPINTEADEHGFMVSTDGNYGYFSSSLEDKGLDIYHFKLPNEARPEEVIFVKGNIESKDPDAAKGMKIELKNMATEEVVEGVVDEESGEYVAVITAKESEDVMMMAKKNGYAFTSQYINSDKDIIGKPRRVEPLAFNPIETGETYRINNINFATDSYDLNDQVANILNEFVVFLEENPSVKIAIHGHTDNVGDEKDNLILSEKRAATVMRYLILEGISPARLQYKGFGESQPVADNTTEEGRAKNRRTEFVILSK
jgi:outer membrane protein OmpA-like peptidoglycan-associated protein